MNAIDKVIGEILIFEDLFKRLEDIHYSALERGYENEYVLFRKNECKEILDRLYMKKDILIELDWHKLRWNQILEVINNGLLKECLEEKLDDKNKHTL
jgi:hypothetical protein